jgi:PII-like signaling protein
VSGLGEGDALELRFHFGERDRDGGGPLDAAVMDACARRGVWAAALMRGVEGFGASALVRTERVLSLSEDQPLVAVAVGERDVIERLAEEVREIAAAGLLTTQEVDVVGGGGLAVTGGENAVLGDSEGIEGGAADAAGLVPTGTPTTSAAGVGVPVGASPAAGVGDVVRATVWGPRTGPRSPHLRAVDALYRHGAESATVLLGVDGVLDGERRRARFVAANRGVPAVTVAVGERGAIDAALAELGALANLVTIEAVERSSRYARGRFHGEGGVEPNRRYATESLHGSEGGVERNSVDDRLKLHGGGPSGAGEGTRVTLVTSEATQGGDGPLYLTFIDALRRGGAPGATALRGVWGFRGDVAPHGDRVLALRREVPLIVEVVDSPERSAQWLEIAGSLRGDSDLAYSQAVGRRIGLD